ncbi:MAG: SUMF1/EgtB/PvdO family nonheme iron enzyme [Myxococcota bacterium]|nr:SUMF1/EgtB/PvdO family nonheme iron enzyme [Myxococcota bacterium]
MLFPACVGGEDVDTGDAEVDAGEGEGEGAEGEGEGAEGEGAEGEGEGAEGEGAEGEGEGAEGEGEGEGAEGEGEGAEGEGEGAEGEGEGAEGEGEGEGAEGEGAEGEGEGAEGEGECGSWDAPCPVPALPAVLTGDTRESTVAEADSYSPCAPATREDGPEIVYSWTAPADGILGLTLDDAPGDAVDVDVHLLDGDGPDSCLARDNRALSRRVSEGGTYRIVVDTWFNGTSALAGPYTLTVTFTPTAGGCPEGMTPVAAACMDLYEAPNRAGALPLVMYSYVEAGSWCAARGKRLCYDDEWTTACAGEAGSSFPYGDVRVPGVCRDEALWRQYDQPVLNGWPPAANRTDVESLDALLAAVRALGANAAADHVLWLYQAAGSGDYDGCVNEQGVFDTIGNVEEWTIRRDGGAPQFHGNLKGRYWADSRTCQANITVHGDGFRFYEIGFRCCLDP